MKKITALLLYGSLLILPALVFWGCTTGVEYDRCMSIMESAGYFPHGGVAHVNEAPASAMFFKNYGVNPFIDTDEDHLSTFAIDVDTASYTITRRYLNDGHLPPEDAVRVEEFVKGIAAERHESAAGSQESPQCVLPRFRVEGGAGDQEDSDPRPGQDGRVADITSP